MFLPIFLPMFFFQLKSHLLLDKIHLPKFSQSHFITLSGSSSVSKHIPMLHGQSSSQFYPYGYVPIIHIFIIDFNRNHPARGTPMAMETPIPMATGTGGPVLWAWRSTCHRARWWPLRPPRHHWPGDPRPGRAFRRVGELFIVCAAH